MSDDLERKIEELAEAIIDQLNRDAQDGGPPVLLTSCAFVVEGNGWTEDGQHLTRGFRTYFGSASQVIGLLTVSIDDVRNQDLDR